MGRHLLTRAYTSKYIQFLYKRTTFWLSGGSWLRTNLACLRIPRACIRTHSYACRWLGRACAALHLLSQGLFYSPNILTSGELQLIRIGLLEEKLQNTSLLEKKIVLRSGITYKYCVFDYCIVLKMYPTLVFFISFVFVRIKSQVSSKCRQLSPKNIIWIFFARISKVNSPLKKGTRVLCPAFPGHILPYGNFRARIQQENLPSASPGDEGNMKATAVCTGQPKSCSKQGFLVDWNDQNKWIFSYNLHMNSTYDCCLL